MAIETPIVVANKGHTDRGGAYPIDLALWAAGSQVLFSKPTEVAVVNSGLWEAQRSWILVALKNQHLDRVRLMKTLFLSWYIGTDRAKGPFHFEPYLYGPYSQDVYRTLDALERMRLIVQPGSKGPSRDPYHLTPVGQGAAAEAERRLASRVKTAISTFATFAASSTFDDLLAKVYAIAPEFATRSVAGISLAE